MKLSALALQSFFLRNHPIWVLTIIWFGLIALIQPLGDFPVNDDWAYAHNVWELSQNGQFKFSDWPAMTLVTQTVIGSISTLFFGFSHEVLRFTTIVFGCFTILIAYRVVWKELRSSLLAYLFAGFIISHPFMLTLSSSFMTEVYFLFFMLGSIYFLLDYMKDSRFRNLPLLVLFMIGAVLVRQTALILPLAYLFVLLIFKFTRRERLIGLGTVALVFGVFQLYALWRAGLPEGLGKLSSISMLIDSVLGMDAYLIYRKLTWILFYLGLSTVPLLFFTVPKLNIRNQWIRNLFFLPLSASVAFLFWYFWEEIPVGNTLNDEGFGPRLLKDNWLEYNKSEVINGSLWTFLKNLSLVTLLFNGLFVFQRLPKLTRVKGFVVEASVTRQKNTLLFTTVLGLCFFQLFNPVFFDRYTFLISILIGLSIILHIGILNRYLVISCFGFMGFIAIIQAISLNDYFSFQSARWALIERAEREHGVSKDQLDGGFEYNAWYRTGPLTKPVRNPNYKSWWFINDDEYLIASGDMVGFQTVHVHTYDRILNGGKDSILLLRRYIREGIDHRKYPIYCGFEYSSKSNSFLVDDQKNAYMENHALRSDVAARTGLYSIRIFPNSRIDLFTAEIVQSKEVFEFECWVHCDQGNSAPIFERNANGELTREGIQQTELDTKDNWTKYRIQFENRSNKIEVLKLVLYNEGTGNFYLDDLWINRRYISD